MWMFASCLKFQFNLEGGRWLCLGVFSFNIVYACVCVGEGRGGWDGGGCVKMVWVCVCVRGLVDRLQEEKTEIWMKRNEEMSGTYI